VGALNPASLPWRSAAALAAHRLGDEEAARRLVDEELRLASDFGAPGPLGRAMRTAGVIANGSEGLELLGRAVALGEGSQAALERARTLIEFGAALRRSRRRADSRGPLQAGADLAVRCGAERLAARARDELVASGSRPRRLALSGIEALTPRERQVAELAAEGMSNREIAEALFVTRKTVEWHLRNAYEKLGVRSRAQLRAPLLAAAAGHNQAA
jgi:DNA-binding CsgD family transcriptional regulator